MREYTGPAILIAVGAYLLAIQLDFLSFRPVHIITYGFLLMGILLLLNAAENAERRGLLGGIFFLTYGLSLSLVYFHYFYPEPNFIFGALFMSLAFANLVYFFTRTDRMVNLVSVFIFGAIGGLLLSFYYGIMYPWHFWEIWYQIKIYWPVILIILGITIIISAYRKRNSVSVNGM